jgi:hypothetical protein
LWSVQLVRGALAFGAFSVVGVLSGALWVRVLGLLMSFAVLELFGIVFVCLFIVM